MNTDSPEPAQAQVLPGDASQSSRPITLAWLIQVRWAAFVAQVAAILGTQALLEPRLATGPLLSFAAVVGVTNIWARSPRVSARIPQLAGGLLFLDTLLLTAMLFVAGGVANPFSIFYLVNIALAAVVLSAAWTTLIATVAIVGYAFLFAVSPSMMTMDHAHGFETHLRGMWVAFVLSAFLVSFFVIRLRRVIEQRDAELAHEKSRAIRSEKLAALVTLAGGAAHELATPLGTIALVSSELQRPGVSEDERLADLRLIRSEVDRCRAILDDMAAGSGTVTGEALERLTASSLIEACLLSLSPQDAARISVTVTAAGGSSIVAPPRALRRCLDTLIRNAIDATPPGEAIELKVGADGASLTISVTDHGTGMPAEDLARAGEPFWTTKGAGRGMGLGLFLVRSTLEPLKGELGLESVVGRGTSATMTLPLARMGA